ncbi:MAG: PAS domain S-box protein [Proteobacteria bacterium]|nr:PAS domain S-box protein [Pseudomonadota bacterium]
MIEKDKITQAEDIPAAPTHRSRSRWYAGYFVLSVVNIVTIAAGILLNDRLVRQYEESNEQNRYWSEQLTDYAELETLLATANAPGNDVFSSLDARAESARLEEALDLLDRHFAGMRERHNPYPTAILSQDWAGLLGAIEDLAARMGDQARDLLTLFAAGEFAGAGERMASMDRIHVDIILIVNHLEQEAQELQRASLGEQVRLAGHMRNIQYFIGSLVALLVLGVAAYGYRLSRQMSRSDAERAAQLKALEVSEQRFRELAEGSIQGIVVHRNGVPLFINDAWARIHGFESTADARALDNIASLIVPEDRGSVRDIQDDLQHGVRSSRQYEYRATRRDGKTVWLECQERVVIWQGEPVLQSTVIDETERKQAEDGLREAMLQAEQANSARTRFFAAASHDLRQPLHAISLYLPLLLKRMEKSENREMLGAIQNSCNAMRSLLDSLLDISRLDAGVIEPEISAVPLLDVFDQLGMEFTPQAAAKGLELNVVPANYWVRSDAVLLERILRNLLTNAIRYTAKGKILLGARRAGSSVRIEVWDTGIGVDHDTLDHIFEEFYQADNPERDRSRGLGLGLAIIERLATLLEHKLGVRSWPGRGSVFDITLSLTDEPAADDYHERHAPQPAGSLQGRLALLIDDDPMILEGTEAMLEDWGCRVITAASISDAVETVRDTGLIPDVIMADLRLRGAETGLDAVAALNKILARPVPAIIVTGDTDPTRIKQASASGLAILHKPVEPLELQSAILEAIRGANAGTPESGGAHRAAN